MEVVVNTRYLLKNRMEGFGVYTHELMRRMTASHPEDTFQFVFDRPFDQKFVYADNVHPIVLGPPARHPILYFIWYQMRLKRQIHSKLPDVFFSPDSYMPLGLKVPTILTVHDVAPRRFPDHITGVQSRYYLHFMPRFLRAAAHIITVSEFSKREIQHFYDVPEEKISVVHNGVSSRFIPVSSKEKQDFRDRYSQGKPFLLYVGAIHPRKNVAALIHAFDVFKRDTDCEVQLVITGQKSWKTDVVGSAIAAAKHDGDIHLCGYIPDEILPGLIGSALAMCYVSLYEGFGMPVLEAMACGVPVITSAAESTGGALAEVAGDAAITVDPESVVAIANAMSKMVSDKDLQSRLSQRGLERTKDFSWDRAAILTYASLQKSAHT